MPVEKQSGVGFLTPGSYLVFKIMSWSLWTCSKSLMPYSIQFINNYKFLLQPLLGPAFLLFFLSPTMPEWPSHFPYFLQCKSEFVNKEFMIEASVLSQSCFCWLYRASSPLAANIINLILVLTIWWCPCVGSSLVLLREGVCHDQCVLLAKLY